LARQYDEFCDNSAGLPPIGNQGNQLSCTCWASGYYLKTYHEGQERGWDLTVPEHQCSPAFLYNQLNGGEHGGVWMIDIFNMLCDHGCATLEDMPYHDWDWTTLPDETAYRNGIDFRCEEWYFIDTINDGLDDLKTYLLNGGVAVIVLHVYDNLFNIAQFNNIYCVSQVGTYMPGGHVVTVCGFDDEMVTADGIGALKAANSWGPFWGNSGYFWISYEAATSPTTCWSGCYYADDKIGYEPTLISRFHVDSYNAHNLQYLFGIGDYSAPAWEKAFFDWMQDMGALVTYPASNIVIDLTDGAAYMNPSAETTFFMGGIDPGGFVGHEGTITYFQVQELISPATSASLDPPLMIPQSYNYEYVELVLDPTVVLGAPENLVAELDTLTGTVTLSWEYAGLSDDFQEFFVYRDGYYRGGGTETSFIDDLPALGTFQYTVSAVYDNGESDPAGPVEVYWGPPTAVVEQPPAIPAEWGIICAYPNPFNPMTVVSFGLPNPGLVSLNVYNLQGKKVAQLLDGWYPAGMHCVSFRADNLPGGLYFVQCTTGQIQRTNKVLLMK
jgi:hypothetical protein